MSHLNDEPILDQENPNLLIESVLIWEHFDRRKLIDLFGEFGDGGFPEIFAQGEHFLDGLRCIFGLVLIGGLLQEHYFLAFHS